MKKLIGLLAVIFIASAGQAFAKGTLDKVNKDSVFFVKSSTQSDSADYVKAKVTDFLSANNVTLVAEEAKSDFILNITNINFSRPEAGGLASTESKENFHELFIGIEVIERSSYKILAKKQIHETAGIDLGLAETHYCRIKLINEAFSSLDSDGDVIYFLERTKK